MSSMGIDQVLAQIRSMSAQASGGISPGNALNNVASTANAAQAAGSTSSTSFGAVLKQTLNDVNSSQQTADKLATAWEQGKPGVDLAQVMVETQKASVSFRALTEVRNRLVTAYQDIMNMQI